jgi:hypothetical protein
MNNAQYKPTNAVLCFEKFKEAALYFDKVIPLNMGRILGDPIVGDILVGYPESIPSAALSHLIDGVEGNTTIYSHASRIMDVVISKWWREFAIKVSPYANLWVPPLNETRPHNISEEHRKLQQAYLADASIDGEVPIRAAFAAFASCLGIKRFCLALPNNSENEGTQTDPSIMLSHLNLIDASHAE